jgi:hypothetical protein
VVKENVFLAYEKVKVVLMISNIFKAAIGTFMDD